MDRGSRLAIDVGTVRIGLAVSDPDSILSTPLPALIRSKLLGETLQEILSLITDNGVVEVFIGDPLSLSGSETESTKDARQFANQLAELTSVPVRLVDERLTTVTASSKLRLNGLNAKTAKGLIDSASAVEILEQALNITKQSGKPAGSRARGLHD
jgi:putative Holliday junction resolvase